MLAFFGIGKSQQYQQNEHHKLKEEKSELNNLTLFSKIKDQQDKGTNECGPEPVFLVVDMLRDFRYLVEDQEFEQIEEAIQFYKGLAHNTFSEIEDAGSIQLFREIEYMISKKVEARLQLEVSKIPIKDFKNELDGLIWQRTKNVEFQFQQIILRKSAIYSKLLQLIKIYKNEEEKIRNITLILNMSQGTLELEDQKLNGAERYQLNQDLKQYIADIKEKNELEIHEEMVMELSKQNLDLINLKMKYNSGQKIYKPLKLQIYYQSKMFNNKLKALKMIDSKNSIIRSIQSFSIGLNQRVENQNNANEITQSIKNKDNLEFVNRMVIIKNELMQQSQYGEYNLEVKNRMLEIIKIALTQIFQDSQVAQKNQTLLSLMEQHKTNNQKGSQKDGNHWVYDLIDLIEFDEVLSKGDYQEFMMYLETINRINGIKNDIKKDLALLIQNKLNNEIQGFRKEINILFKRERDHRLLLALNILENKAIKLAEQKATIEGFSFLYKSLECIKKYIRDQDLLLQSQQTEEIKQQHDNLKNNQIKNDGQYDSYNNNKNQNKQPQKEKERGIIVEFLKGIIDILNKGINDGFQRYDRKTIHNMLYDFIDQIQTINPVNMDLHQEYLSYLNFRIELGEFEDISDQINREKIENKLINLENNLIDSRNNSDNKEMLYQFVQQANVLINEWYTKDITKSIDLIQQQLNEKNKELSELKNSVIDIYQKRLKRDSKLIMRGQVFFLDSLIDKVILNQLNRQQKAMHELSKEFNTIGEMQTQKDIESYLIGKVNKIGLLQLRERIKDNGDSISRTINNLNFIEKKIEDQVSYIHSIIFAEDNSVAKKVIRLLGQIVDSLSKQKQTSLPQNLSLDKLEGEQEDTIKQVIDYLRSIEIVIGLIIFDCKDEQEIINDVKEELMELASEFDKCNQIDSELSKKLSNVITDLIEACYRRYCFLCYSDKQDFNEFSIDFNKKKYTLSTYIRNKLRIVDFNRILNINKCKKRIIMEQVQNKLKDLTEQVQLYFYSSKQIDEKIDEIILNFREEQENKHTQQSQLIKLQTQEQKVKNKLLETSKELQKSTNYLELDKDESRVKELIIFKDLDVISQDLAQNLKLQFINNYRQKFGSGVNQNIKNFESSDLEHIKRIWLTIEQISDIDIKLQTYQFYYGLFKDLKRKIVKEELDQLGISLVSQLFGEKSFPLKIIESKIQNQDFKYLADIIQFLPLFSYNIETKQKVIQLLRLVIEKLNKLKEHRECIIHILKALIQYNSQISCYKSNSILVSRIVDIINLLANLLLEKQVETGETEQTRLKNLIIDFNHINKQYQSLSEDLSQENIINNIIREELDKNKWIKYLLKEEEVVYAQFLDTDQKIETIQTKPVHLWQDEFENLYIISASSKLLQKEMEEIEQNIKINSLKKMINKLVKSTYFDESKIKLSNINIEILKYTEEELGLKSDKILNILNLISSFKNHLFASKELITNKSDWVNMVENIINKRKTVDQIQLKTIIELLKYVRFFDNINQLIRIILEGESQKQIMLGVLRHILSKIPSIQINKEENRNNNELLDQFNIFTPNDQYEHIIQFISGLARELDAGVRYENSEMILLRGIVHSYLLMKVHQNSKIVNQLKDMRILKWANILREEKIKRILDRNDEKLIRNIISIEKIKGIKLVNELINIIKDENLSDFEVNFIIEKFKRNIWDLSNELLDRIREKGGKLSKQKIEKYDSEFKKNELSAAQLVSHMKRLEGEGEINYSIKHLIQQDEKDHNLTLIEKCLQQIDTNPKINTSLYNQKATVVNLIEVNDQGKKQNSKKKISEYTSDDIKVWAQEYKSLKKSEKEGKGIQGNGILEFMAVISRAIIIVKKFDLRVAQKIALFLFIDSMVNSFQGRLANISTGEGKSLITIVTAIAKILINGGGNVDILTSSQVLAVRDAEESEQIFNLFNLKVSNNCDEIANSDEKIRKERYLNNDIIYGEISHFQRDILLTKYFSKQIRNKVGSCLIVDEVDNMCIDNMCNTLYISHPIADLRCLKDMLVFIWQIVNLKDTEQFTPSNVQQVKRSINLLIEKEIIVFPKHLEDFVEKRKEVWINNAYIAKTQMEAGHQYSILGKGKNIGETVINDLQTGVEQFNTQWSEGLQQFIQLKHTNKLTEETLKAIFMSNYIYFKEYGGDVYGMSGTLGANIERDLLKKSYGLDFFQLPRFKKELNIREEGLIVCNRVEWLQCIKQEVAQIIYQDRLLNSNEIELMIKQKEETSKKIISLNKQIESKNVERIKLEQSLQELKNQKNNKMNIQNEINYLQIQQQEEYKQLEKLKSILGEERKDLEGRAVLIICSNKKDVEDIIKELAVRHKSLYEYKGKIDGLRKVEKDSYSQLEVLQEVCPGDIIVATNVAGRGTDFKLSDQLEKNGGLHVIVSYVPDNIRVENQAFGRSGRKGQPGSGRIIAYDSRGFSLEALIDERDQEEEKRLRDIRIKMIPRVELERELFQKFSNLSEEINSHFQNKEEIYQELQKKALHNKWAYWLDKMGTEIYEIYTTKEKGQEIIFEKFEKFAEEMKCNMKRSGNGIDGFIDEPGELIKYIKYNISEGKFKEAVKNCNYMIEAFGKQCSAFAYYYKAIAIFRSSYNKSQLEQFISNHKSVIEYEEKKDGIGLLKKAIELFEMEISRIKMRSLAISNLGKEKRNTGIGSSVDYFSKSNVNEIIILQIHLNAARKSLSQELNLFELEISLFNSIVSQEARSIYQKIIENPQLSQHIKQERLSKKVKIFYHVNEIEELIMILGEKEFERARSQNEDNLGMKEFKNQRFSFTKENRLLLDKAGIQYMRELYLLDRFETNYKLIHFPHHFNYCKNSILESIENAESSIISRTKILEFKSCLTKEKVWQLLEINNIVEKATCICLRLSDDYLRKLENNNLWTNQIFNGEGEEIKKKLVGALTSDSREQIHIYIKQEDLNNLLESKSGNIMKRNNGNKIQELLLNENFLVRKGGMFTLNKSSMNKICQYQEEIILKLEIKTKKIENLCFDNLMLLKQHKDTLTKFLQGKLGKKIEKKEIECLLQGLVDQEEFDNVFLILKNILISQNMAETLLIKLKFKKENQNDIFENNKIEDIIEQLYEKRYFTQEDIVLASTEQLVQGLKFSKVVKGKQIKYPLRRNHMKVDELKKILTKVVRKEIKNVINQQLKDGKFILEFDIQERFYDQIQKESISLKKLKLLCSEIQNQLGSKKDQNNNQKRETLEEDQVRIHLKTLIKEKRETQVEKLSQTIVVTLLDTIGTLKSGENVSANCKNIQDYFKDSSVPKEINEYVLLQRDLVLSFSEYDSPLCWKVFAVVLFGTLQIIAGSLMMAQELLPSENQIGTFLFYQGVVDIVYAIQNVGKISGSSYFENKMLSIFLSIQSFGIESLFQSTSSVRVSTALRGGSAVYLKGGSVALGVAKQRITNNASQKAIQKLSVKYISETIIKQIKTQVGNFSILALKSKEIDKMGNLVTTLIFEEFKNTIEKMIQEQTSYIDEMNQLTVSLQELTEEITDYHEYLDINSQVEEFISESEQELNANINNNIIALLGQIIGPLSEQITKSQNFKLEFLRQGQFNEESNSAVLLTISNSISILFQSIKKCEAAFQLQTLTIDLLKLINTKVTYKKQILLKNRPQNPKQLIQGQSKGIVEYQMRKIIKRVFANMRNKVELNLINPTFNKLINHALKPYTEILRKSFFNDFYNLKKRALIYRENESRYNQNRREQNLELEQINHILMNDFYQPNFDTPITQTDLDYIKSGKLLINVDGKRKELNMSLKKDKNFIRDKFGAKRMRIIPGNPPSLSRPNYINYLEGWNQQKEINEIDLEMIAYYLNYPIVIEKSNGEKMRIGPENEIGEKPLYLRQNLGNQKNKGKKIGDIEELPNFGNYQDIESIIYLKKFKELKKQGQSDQEADKNARNHLKDSKIKQDFINSVREHALKKSELRDVYLGRSHQKGAVGPVEQAFIISESSELSHDFQGIHSQKSQEIKNLIQISNSFAKQQEIIDKRENYTKSSEELRQEVENYWEENQDRINKHIQIEIAFGGQHGLIPNDMLKLLFFRNCGLEYGVSPITKFKGKEYNWLDILYAIRVTSTTVFFNHIQENKIMDEAEKNRILEFKYNRKPQNLFYENLRDIVQHSKTIEEALSNVVVYHLSNTQSPRNNIEIGFQGNANQQNINLNQSLDSNRNYLKRLVLQQNLFSISEEGLLISKNGFDILSPIQPGTPRSVNDEN